MLDYMDAAAEWYVAYDFRGLRVGEYASPGDAHPIIGWLYEFGSGAQACGVLQ